MQRLKQHLENNLEPETSTIHFLESDGINQATSENDLKNLLFCSSSK